MTQRSEKHDDSNSEDRGTKESTFLFAKIPTTLRHNRKWYFRYLVPLIIASSMLVWTYPYSNVIYGMDSFNFFLFPLNPVSSPLNLAAGSSAGFYITVFEYTLGIYLVPSAVEHILIFVALFIGVFGIFRLFETYNVLNGLPTEAYVLPKTLAALLYVANPFTLTVVLWHYEGWSLFFLVVPFILSLVFEILYAERVKLETFLLAIIVCLFLAPGASGPFAISILYVLAVVILYIFIDMFRRKVPARNGVLKILVVTLFASLTLLWTNVPAFMMSFVGSTNSFYSLGRLYTFFLYNSEYTQINHVVGLSAYNWIYNFPLAYGWPISYNTVLVYAGYALFAVFVASVIITRSSKITRFSLVVIVPILIVSTGASYPFLSLNRFLLNLGGPFLIVTNSYYFMGQIYVVLMISVIYLATIKLQSLLSKQISKNRFLNLDPAKTESSFIESSRFFRKGSKKHLFAVVFFALVLGLSAVFWTPLFLNEEYQTQHSQIDEFKLPQSLLQMSTFFESNYTYPEFYTLILPLSNEEGYTMSFNNASFTDSGSLFSKLIPYPVISTNRSQFEQELNDFLSGGQYNNLVPVLQSLHIRYVVFNPYYSSSDQGLQYAANGMKVNLNMISEKLTNEVGAPINFGSVHVFTIPKCVPLVYGTNEIGYVTSEDFQTYLEFLSSISSRDENLMPGITSYVWTNNSENVSKNGTANMAINSYNGQNESYLVKENTTILGIGDTGQITNISNALLTTTNDTNYSLTGNVLKVNSPVSYSMVGNGNYSTNLILSNGSRAFSANSSGWVNFTNIGKGNTGFMVDFRFRIDNLAPDHWSQIGVDFSSGNYSVRVDLNGNLSSSLSFFNESAYYNGYKYAWASSQIPISTLEKSRNLLLYIYNDKLNCVLKNETSTSSIFSSPDFYYSLPNYNENPGYNATPLPVSNSVPDMNNSAVQFLTSGVNGSIQDMAVMEELPIKFILFENGVTNNPFSNLTFSYNYEGDIRAQFSNGSQSESLYIVLSCSNPSQWVVLGDSSMTSELYPSAFQSVFVVENTYARDNIQIGVDGYAHLINIGLFVSIFELIGMITLLFLRARRKI